MNAEVDRVLTWLETHSTPRDRDNLERFAITAPKFFGVSMASMRVLAKELGRDHALAAALWDAGWYEARTMAALIDDPGLVTPAQMDRWCRDFDNWAICDTACFHLFDRTPHAWSKVKQWSARREEFVKRAAFALLASLALHDKKAADEPFLDALPLIVREAGDERNFVKKALVWALRGIGGRNAGLREAALATAHHLAESQKPAPRWVGKTTLRELNSPAAKRRAAKGKGDIEIPHEDE